MRANQIVLSSTSIDTAFLDVTIGTKQSSWTAEISLTNHPIQHTGVEVTAIFDKVFSSLYNAKLQKVSKVLLGLVQQKLAVTSQFDDHFLHKGEAYQHPVFVVKGLKNNPLGLPSVIALNLVIRVNEISDHNTDIPKMLPKIFQGLGNMCEAYSIKLKPGAQPRTIYAPHNAPLPLKDKFKNWQECSQ